MNNVFVTTRADKTITLIEWQQLYGLKACTNQLGKFFFADEAIFAKDIKNYGKLVVNELLIRVLDEFRVRAGRAIHINSFNRDLAKQESLTAEGYRTAKTSPHVALLAADIDTLTKEETMRFVPILLQVARDLNIKIRVGYLSYLRDGNTFIHVDVCPEYYCVGKPRHSQPHPSVWENQYFVW